MGKRLGSLGLFAKKKMTIYWGGLQISKEEEEDKGPTIYEAWWGQETTKRKISRC